MTYGGSLLKFAALAGRRWRWRASQSAQEVSGGATTTAKAMPSTPNVTQAALDGAASDRKNWIHPNGDYTNSRYYPGTAIKTRRRLRARARVRLPDRGARVDGDRADRRRRRHVPDDVVQPRLCDQRGDRRGILALQAQARPDRHGLLRQQQPRRRDRGRPAVHGHDRCEARRARRQDRQGSCGRSRSPIPRRATRRRWRQRSSRARC